MHPGANRLTFLRTIGTMSGTSLDGVDVAFVETDGHEHVKLGPTGFTPYGDPDRNLLRAALAAAAALTDRAARPGVLADAEAMVTARHHEAVERFLREHGIARESVDLVGFHGQTVLHRPAERLTVQIGDGGTLAQALRIAVVCDFRAADVAAGGQGAPLVPAFHRALVLAAAIRDPVVLVNIGGVANITLVSGTSDPVACDTGPGNALLDDLMLARTGEAIDRDGLMAAAGRADEAALERLLDHPFFALPPPKSLDRNAFSADLLAGLGTEDAAATLTAFTARSIADCLRHLSQEPTRLIVCGGGANNPTLLRALSECAPCPVATADALGWHADAVEAQAFGYLAARSVQGLPLTFPTTTGVPTSRSGGRLVRP